MCDNITYSKLHLENYELQAISLPDLFSIRVRSPGEFSYHPKLGLDDNMHNHVPNAFSLAAKSMGTHCQKLAPRCNKYSR